MKARHSTPPSHVECRCSIRTSLLPPSDAHSLILTDMHLPELSWATHLSLNMVMSAPIPRRGIFEFAQAYGSVVLKVMGPLMVFLQIITVSPLVCHSSPSLQVCLQVPLVWSDSVTDTLSRAPRGSGGCDASSPWHAWAAVRTLTEGCGYRSNFPQLMAAFNRIF